MQGLDGTDLIFSSVSVTHYLGLGLFKNWDLKVIHLCP